MSDADVPVAVRKNIGVFGGSFDPVHLGHLRSVLEVKQALSLDEMRIVPSGNPQHRDSARVAAKHRVAMLQLAVQQTPGIEIDQREVQNTGTSYSIDTLASVAADHPGSHLTLVIGMDQFSVFDTWHRWQEILQNCRLAVMERPGETLSDTGRSILQRTNKPGNADIIHVIAVTQMEISSSRIRDDLARHKDIRFLVPSAVRDYIQIHKLYTGAV